MANLRGDQAPAPSEIGLAAVSTLVAILVALIDAPGLAQAAEGGADLPQAGNPSSLAPAPVMTTAPAADDVSGAPSPTRWARVPRWQKALGVGAILAGLAAVGSGAYLLWLDGQYTCRSAGCTPFDKYNTALAGWLLMAGGTAASLGGVTLVLVPPIGESRSRAVAGLALSACF
jgi:hypothetical protein